MSNTFWLSLIPFYCLAYVFLFGFFFEKFYRFCLAKKSFDTKEKVVANLGLIVYVCGQIGCGKTTFGSALANDFALIFAEKANETIADVRLAIPDIDFDKVDSEIDSAYLSGISNPDYILNVCLSDLRNLESESKGYYYDYLFPVSKVSLIKDYIKARIAIDRDNWTYFVGRKYYCFVNNRWAMDFFPEMLNIKERHQSKDYSIADYSVVFEDEKILSGSDSMHSSEIAKEDNGKSVFFRLIRHLGKGNIRYITTCQDFGRDVKEQRELATDICYITKRTEIPVFSFGLVFSNLLFSILSDFYFLKNGLEVSFKKRADDSLTLKERKKLSSVNQRIKKCYSDFFIKYDVNHFSSSSDFDKGVKPVSMDFCFPISFAYGGVDTYAFSFVGDVLSFESIDKQSWVNPNDDSIPFFNPDLAKKEVDRLLQRRFKNTYQKSNENTLKYPF